MNSPVNIICMKWGDKYGPEYVNRLRSQVTKNISIDHRFVCITDSNEGLNEGIETLPIPDLEIEGPRGNTTWKKLGVFSDQLGDLQGPALFLDLDIIICGSLDPLFSYKPDRICIIHNWIAGWKTLFRPRPEIGNSSVFRFPANECNDIIEHFQNEKQAALENWWPPQTYLTERIRDRMAYWPEDWIKSFKFHCRPAFPANYFFTPKKPEQIGNPCIIAFHGRPNPDQAIQGFKGKRLHHYVKPTAWIEKYWQS